MKVILANDHGAVKLAKRLVEWLEENGNEVTYMGVPTETPSVDYPDIAEDACRAFLKGDYDFGILCCGTGMGMCIAANKINGIRCAQPYDCYMARMAKEHNAANFLAFGGRIGYKDPIGLMLRAFMEAEVDHDDRHERRRAKVRNLENPTLLQGWIDPSEASIHCISMD